MFNKIYANCLLVNDFEKSLAFYKDKLGFGVDTQDGKFANFKVQGTSLAIFQKDEAVAMFPKKYMGTGGGIILAFQVEKLDEACKKLQSNGIKFFEGPKETVWGQKVAYFMDPDKNILEISEPFEEKVVLPIKV